MDMMQRLAAARAKINDMKETVAEEPTLPAGWTDTGRTKRGKPVYQVYAVYAKPANPVRKALEILPIEAGEHEEGGTCPHCMGSGRYSAHRGHFSNEKCYRCHGKGVLDRRDLAFYQNRMKGAGPICHIVTA